VADQSLALVVRWLYSSGREPLVRFVDDFDTPAIAEARWLVRGLGAGFVRTGDGAVTIRPPAGTPACLQALLPDEPTTRLGRWVPGDLLAAASSEALSWQGAVTLDRDYFILLEWGPLLLQRTAYGLHLTYPDPGGRLIGHEIRDGLGSLDTPRRWRVERSATDTALWLDDQRLWSGGAQPLGYRPCFGEARSDPAHAGQLRLEWVRYERRVGSGRSAR
jgi:hypothetical protein